MTKYEIEPNTDAQLLAAAQAIAPTANITSVTRIGNRVSYTADSGLAEEIKAAIKTMLTSTDVMSHTTEV